MECVSCGLAPFDLPDGVDPDDVFESDDTGEVRCMPCSTGRRLTITTYPTTTED